jgi:hypothetical protein
MRTADPTVMSSPNGNFRHHPSLAEALQFTDADLAANRQGRLGEGQKALLQARLSSQPIIGLLMASVPLTFVIVSVITLFATGQWSRPSDPTALGIVVIILIIASALGLVPLFVILRRWRVSKKALAQGTVHSIEGYVEIEPSGRRTYLIVHNDVGEEVTLSLRRGADAAFVDCDRYRIYYLPVPPRVVAAECLDG